jgi:hypothetical protein
MLATLKGDIQLANAACSQTGQTLLSTPESTISLHERGFTMRLMSSRAISARPYTEVPAAMTADKAAALLSELAAAGPSR